MSGHSKWSTIKRKKGAVDAKRGKLFTKLAREITVSAKLGGGDPDGNPRLRAAIQAARSGSLPKDKINEAIKRGTGELDGGDLEELVYEGYGPGGVAFIVDTATDNLNRTVSALRSMFDKSGGSLAKTGAVAFKFNKRGLIRVDAAKHSEEQVMEAALEAGAEDVEAEGEALVVSTTANDLHQVAEAMEKAQIEIEGSEIAMIPTSTVACDLELARKVQKLMDKLEDHDDVQNVWVDADIPDDVMTALEESS